MEPILTSQGITYKRNVLLICAVASMSLLDGVDISKAKIFDVGIGKHLWEVGLFLLLYHLVSYIFEGRQGWLKWKASQKLGGISILELFGKFQQEKPESPKGEYARNKLYSEDGNLGVYQFRFNADGSSILKGKKKKVNIVNGEVTSDEYKLLRTQALHFGILDILPILVGLGIAIVAYCNS